MNIKNISLVYGWDLEEALHDIVNIKPISSVYGWDLEEALYDIVNIKTISSVYGWDLEEAFKDETSSPFEDLLVKVLNRPRFDETGSSSKNS